MSKQTARAPITADQARRRRNIATALAILGFMLLVFFVTMARIKGNILDHPY